MCIGTAGRRSPHLCLRLSVGKSLHCLAGPACREVCISIDLTSDEAHRYDCIWNVEEGLQGSRQRLLWTTAAEQGGIKLWMDAGTDFRWPPGMQDQGAGTDLIEL